MGVRATATIPVMGPEAGSESFDIGASIRSVNTSAYLNIVAGGEDTSYKTLAFAADGPGTSGWGLEGTSIHTSKLTTSK